MADSKLVFTPESTQELFNGWLLHAYKARDRHDLSSRWFELSHYVVGVPALVLTTVVGTSVSSHLNANGSPPYWVAVISIIAAVVTALQTFLDFAKRAERHRAITAKYKAAIRLTQQYRTELAIAGSLPAETVTSLRGQFDALEADAPGFFPMVFGKVDRRYRNATHVQEALGLSGAQGLVRELRIVPWLHLGDIPRAEDVRLTETKLIRDARAKGMAQGPEANTIAILDGLAQQRGWPTMAAAFASRRVSYRALGPSMSMTSKFSVSMGNRSVISAWRKGA